MAQAAMLHHPAVLQVQTRPSILWTLDPRPTIFSIVSMLDPGPAPFSLPDPRPSNMELLDARGSIRSRCSVPDACCVARRR
eukprot:858895-Rhodomonas_salina.2